MNLYYFPKKRLYYLVGLNCSVPLWFSVPSFFPVCFSISTRLSLPFCFSTRRKSFDLLSSGVSTNMNFPEFFDILSASAILPSSKIDMIEHENMRQIFDTKWTFMFQIMLWLWNEGRFRCCFKCCLQINLCQLLWKITIIKWKSFHWN